MIRADLVVTRTWAGMCACADVMAGRQRAIAVRAAAENERAILDMGDCLAPGVPPMSSAQALYSHQLSAAGF